MWAKNVFWCVIHSRIMIFLDLFLFWNVEKRPFCFLYLITHHFSMISHHQSCGHYESLFNFFHLCRKYGEKELLLKASVETRAGYEQKSTNYKLSITNYLHLSCNDRDKGAEVTFTLQSLGGSGGPTFQHHCVSFSGGLRIFLLLSPLFHDGHIFSIIVFITTIVYSDISDQNLQE